MGICYIVGAGTCEEDFHPQAGDLLIAADGGYLHCLRRGLVPDLLIGDFDSLNAVPDRLPDRCQMLRYPSEKNETDLELSVQEGEHRGYRRFLLLGALSGPRLDHTVAGLQLLCGCAERGLTVLMSGGGQRVTAIHNTGRSFPSDCRGYLSVFAFGGAATGVTLSGVKYRLEEATLQPDIPLGVSNEFLPGQSASVRVSHGTLLLVWQGTRPLSEQEI